MWAFSKETKINSANIFLVVSLHRTFILMSSTYYESFDPFMEHKRYLRPIALKFPP